MVTGATGYIGSRLVPVLLAAGFEVLAGAGDPSKLQTFDTTGQPARGGAVPVQLDVTDAASCRAALGDHGAVEVAYYLVHGLGEGDFAQTDLAAARTFRAAALEAGVRRIVYLGGLVPTGEELSEHLESRRVVATALRAGAEDDGTGEVDEAEHPAAAQRRSRPLDAALRPPAAPDLVWLRAAIVLGAGSTSYELIRHLVDRLPLIPVPTWMRHHVQPIAVDDVLHYLRHAASARLPAGGYDIGGPTALPYRDLVAAQARVTGRRRWLVPVPGVSTTLAARVIARLVPLPAALVHDLVESLRNTMVVADGRITSLVPGPAGGLTPLVEALRRSASSPGDDSLAGAGGTDDPLHRTTTDPDWAA